MNYRHIYMRIIVHAKKETLEGKRPSKKSERKNFSDKYFEFHHIFPKSLFPQYKNFKQNLVALTAREHFFCHELLTKIWPSKEMTYAKWRLACAHKNIISSRDYEKTRLEIIPILSERGKLYIGKKNPNYGNHKLAGKNNPMYGKNIKDFMTPEAYENWRKKSKKNGKIISIKLRKKVICIEDNRIMNSCSEACKIYGVSMPTLSRIIRKNIDCKACPGKHFKFI